MRGGMSAARRVAAPGSGAALSIGLSAVIVSATTHEPRVLTVRLGAENARALPFGPLEVEHRTLEIGLRSWVERQTGERLGYVEQLYTFGDRDRAAAQAMPDAPALVVAYLALVREARPADDAEAGWQNWYRYFPWEDWRSGRPEPLAALERRLAERHAAPLARGARRSCLRAARRGVERRAGARTLRTALRGRAGRGSGTRCRPGGAGGQGGRGHDGGRPPPHPGNRDRPVARQDQIPPRRLRADAALVHLAPAAAHGRGLVGGPAAQAELPAARRAAGAGRRDRRGQRPDRRAAGAAGALPPRSRARTPGAGAAAACRAARRDFLAEGA